jgi:hypothetical protein
LEQKSKPKGNRSSGASKERTTRLDTSGNTARTTKCKK